MTRSFMAGLFEKIAGLDTVGPLGLIGWGAEE
jgi:hypothetical protein